MLFVSTRLDLSELNCLLTSLRGTVSARNITLLIDNCVNYYCGLLFSIKYTFVNECFFHYFKLFDIIYNMIIVIFL